MTPEERATLATAIAHHNEMVRVNEEARRIRGRGDDPLRLPIASDALGLAVKVEPLRKALAAFTVEEMNAGNMAPHHVATDLLSTMRTLISTVQGAKLRHVPESIGSDGMPERYRNAHPGNGQ
jgi:hypothetical protein